MNLKERKIYSNRCWVDGCLQPATICFNNGIITCIIFTKTEDAEDYGNNLLMPGVIDVHVHVNEPGRTEWEGFDTATQAAAQVKPGSVVRLAAVSLLTKPVKLAVNVGLVWP